MFSVQEIANWYISRFKKDGFSIGIANLNRHCYIANAWYIERYTKNLISSRIEAWKSGPIFPDLIENHKRDRNYDVIEFPVCGNITQDIHEHLEIVYKLYCGYSSNELKDLVEMYNGAWYITKLHVGIFAQIKPSLIHAEYSAIRKKYENL